MNIDPFNADQRETSIGKKTSKRLLVQNLRRKQEELEAEEVIYAYKTVLNNK